MRSASAIYLRILSLTSTFNRLYSIRSLLLNSFRAALPTLHYHLFEYAPKSLQNRAPLPIFSCGS